MKPDNAHLHAIENMSMRMFFLYTFTDPNGVPDHNRLTMFGSFIVLVLYAIVSLFKTKLGIEYMPDALVGVFTSIILAGLGFTSRETVNKINQEKPDAPDSVNVAATVSGNATATGPSTLNPL